jgi:hypothetical protein
MRFENFNFSDRIAGGVPRPVVLQKKQGNTWKTTSSGKTASNGAFRFTIKTGNPSETLRGFSPRTTYKGRVYGQVGTTPTTVRTVAQTATLSAATTAVTGRTITATAVSSPARAGRGVELQILNGKSWQTIASGKVGANGRGTFRKTAGKPGTYSYRVLMSAYNGAGRMGSAPVKVAVNNGISIPDRKLLACVDDALDLPAGTPISPSEAAEVKGLECEGFEISSLKGLDYFTHLEYLDAPDGGITELAPLAKLSSLQFLNLESNDISDLSPISGLKNLIALGLSNNYITDIKPLGKMTSLLWLDLSYNEIKDITPLAGLKNLQNLYLDWNYITDASPLKNLTPKELVLNGNPICDDAPKTKGCAPVTDLSARSLTSSSHGHQMPHSLR